MSDTIVNSGLRLCAFHGVNREEKEEGQPFLLDIVCHADLKKACMSDDLNDTVSYSAIAKTAAAAFTSDRFDLVERAAEVTAQAILKAYPAVAAVELTLKKPFAPMKAEFDWVGVTIRRDRHA